ncbi:hypothetical protein, partial [Lactobacillus helveticus]|uniref:hypothetical protein n=1 Tax=Lactobacillus helveticus TaxID=1587 RepID=UPI001F2D1B78
NGLLFFDHILTSINLIRLEYLKNKDYIQNKNIVKLGMKAVKFKFFCILIRFLYRKKDLSSIKLKIGLLIYL